MITEDFDPLAILEHLQRQNMQHNQNMVAISEHLVSMSEQISQQHQFNLRTQQQIELLSLRIQGLEQRINKQATPVA